MNTSKVTAIASILGAQKLLSLLPKDLPLLLKETICTTAAVKLAVQHMIEDFGNKPELLAQARNDYIEHVTKMVDLGIQALQEHRQKKSNPVADRLAETLKQQFSGDVNVQVIEVTNDMLANPDAANILPAARDALGTLLEALATGTDPRPEAKRAVIQAALAGKPCPGCDEVHELTPEMRAELEMELKLSTN